MSASASAPASSPTRWTVAQCADALDRGALSSVELTRAFLAAIEARNPCLNAYLTVEPERTLAQAADADRRRAAGERGPLLGVPIALKDNLCTRGTRTTCASRILEHFVPPFDGTVVARLRAAGAVFLGKTNMDEFAMGSSTEHSAFGVVRNPIDPTLIPGGSSGGSAAAVAADLCAAALGSDTGGSIRQPAACCGIVGLKPTYGRVSRYGLVAFASSLDQIGPMTKDVTDAAILLGALAGHDPLDSTSAPLPVADFRAAMEAAVGTPGAVPLRGLRVGMPREYFVGEGLDPAVAAGVRGVLDALAAAGAELVEISLPHTRYAVATYYLVATAEASSNLARYDGVHYGRRAAGVSTTLDLYARSRGEGFGDEVKRRIMLGTYALSAGYYDDYYLAALKVRTVIKRDFEQAFAGACDVIATPVMPTPPFRMGERLADPLSMYLADIFTISTNLAGIPGLAMPCGTTPGGLPLSVQFLAPAFEEARLFRVGRTWELAAAAGAAI